MSSAVELSVITGILKLRDQRGTDFAEFGADNVLEAVDAYLGGAAGWSEELVKRFEGLLAGSNIDGDLLQETWSRLQTGIERAVPQAVRPVIKEFRDYRGANPGKIAWPYSYSAAHDFATSLNGDFKFETDSILSIRAYGKPPEVVKGLLAADKAALAVNIEGTASAAAGIRWPFGLGTASAGAAASVSIATSNYFQHEPGRLIGAALVEDLRAVSVPFARNYIIEQFLRTPSLILSVYTAHGSVELNASLGISAPLSPGPVAGVSLKVPTAYTITGNFETRVARYPDGDINIKIDHKQGAGKSVGIELGVSLHAANILLPVHEALSGALGEARELVDALQTEWTFRNEFQGLVNQALGELSDDPLWTEFVGALLAPEGGEAIADALEARMLASLTRVNQSWRDKLAEAATQIAADSIGGIDQGRRMALEQLVGFGSLESVVGAAIQQKADTLTSEFLARAGEGVEALVEGLVRSNNLALFHPIVRRLKDVDRRVGALRSRVSTVLGGYVAKLQMVEKTVKDVVENQVEMKIGYIRSSARGTSVLADVDISSDAVSRYPDATDNLLAGLPDEITRLAALRNSGIRVNQSVLGRYLAKERTLGFALAVLDFKLEQKSILSSEVEIVRDDITGIITVGARASIEKSQDLLGDERSIELVSVAQLSSARDAGVGGLSAVFNRSEEELTSRELDAFLEGFENAGLITRQQRKAAMAAAFEASGVSLDIIEDAEVVAGISWNDAQLSRLFSSDDPVTYREVFDATAEAVEMLEVFDQDDFERVNRLRGDSPPLSTAGELLLFGSSSRCRKLISKNRGKGPRKNKPGAATRKGNFNLLSKIENWSKNIHGLHNSLMLMADVYHSGNHIWTEDDYAKAQDKINRKLGRWIKLPSLLSSLYARFPWAADSDDRVKENTLALLAVLEALTAGQGNSSLRIHLRYKKGKSSNTRQLV